MVPQITDIRAARAAAHGKARHGNVVAQLRRPRKNRRLGHDDKEALVPLTMYTTTWCGFCKNLKRQLGKAGVEVAEVDIELDPEAAKFVEGVNGGNQTVPTLLFSDGSTMCNPSAAMVQQKLAALAELAS
jgi:mycoredoxin